MTSDENDEDELAGETTGETLAAASASEVTVLVTEVNSLKLNQPQS